MDWVLLEEMYDDAKIEASHLAICEELNEIFMEKENPIEVKNLASRARKIGEMLGKIIASVIKLLKEFSAKTTSAIQKKVTEGKIKMKISTMKSDLKTAGKTNVLFIDVWKYESTYHESVRVLSKLTRDFLKSYEKYGKGLHSTTKFLKKYNKTMEDYQTKLDEIKNDKKLFPANKILIWIEKNTDDNGQCRGIMKHYIEEMEQVERDIKKIELKFETFLKENDYIYDPKTFSEMMHNASRYVYKNADWVSLYAISGVNMLASFISKQSNLGRLTKDHETGNGRIPEDRITDIDHKNARNWANGKYHDKNYSSTRKTVAKATKIVGVGTDMVGLKVHAKAIKDRRNSI